MTRHGVLLLVLAASGLSAACNDELVDEVEADTCTSGLRWIGGNRGSEEMRPGSDCVGCHKDNDGPPLVFGGTVYLDGASEGSGAEPGRNCFGLEGVRVEVRGNDGKLFEAVTNRAGNFFYEGQEEELVKPYSAQIFYQFEDGEESNPPMNAGPIYGGCARCHGQTTPREERPMIVNEETGELGVAQPDDAREAISPTFPIYIQPQVQR